MQKLDTFTTAYIDCALWSSTDESTPTGGYPMDRNYTSADIEPVTLAKMIADCAAFQRDNAELLTADNHVGSGDWEERAGHDFWLTRNGHGAGFWDGDWVSPADKQLTDAAKVYGTCDLYVGDDGKIYSHG